MQMPPSQQQAGEHHHGNISPVESHYPQMGRAQSAAQSQLLSLEQFQTLARENNPTLKQAEAEIRAANARRQQAGLYPNPTVGYTGDEIRGGSVGGGKQGFFVVHQDPTPQERLAHARVLKLDWDEGYPAQRTDMSLPASRAVVRATEMAVGDRVSAARTVLKSSVLMTC